MPYEDTDSGQVISARGLHQMVVNPDYEVVDMESNDEDVIERAILKEDGVSKEWIKLD
jgi:hypothetical protein